MLYLIGYKTQNRREAGEVLYAGNSGAERIAAADAAAGQFERFDCMDNPPSYPLGRRKIAEALPDGNVAKLLAAAAAEPVPAPAVPAVPAVPAGGGSKGRGRPKKDAPVTPVPPIPAPVPPVPPVPPVTDEKNSPDGAGSPEPVNEESPAGDGPPGAGDGLPEIDPTETPS